MIGRYEGDLKFVYDSTVCTSSCNNQGMCIFNKCVCNRDMYVGAYCNHCAPGYAESMFQSRDHSQYVPTQCAQCEAGYWNADASGFACKACAAGFVQPKQIASSACTSCLPGQSTSGSSGSSKCDLCASGMFTSVSGAPECSPCSEGEKQPDKNQSGCLACDAGQYQDTEAQQSCLRYVYGIVSRHPQSL